MKKRRSGGGGNDIQVSSNLQIRRFESPPRMEFPQYSPIFMDPCPLPPLISFRELPLEEVRRFAPRLDLQRFCDLVEILGENGKMLIYPFFDTLNITQTYEAKFETETIFGVIQFPESYLEQFELHSGLNVITDSLWGIPSNMEKIVKQPNSMFTLQCSISRMESFRNKFDHFRHFDAISLEIERLSNHSITFSELLDLTKDATSLSLSINKQSSDIPSYFAEQLLGWNRSTYLEMFSLSGAPESCNLQALCHFVKYKCCNSNNNSSSSSQNRVFIDFRVFNVQRFKQRVMAFKNSSEEPLNFVIYVNGFPFEKHA